jgi:hypothetical protein
MNKKLFEDFCKFSRYQLASWDIDPTYPVLKKYYVLRGFDIETALWFTQLYVAFYHLGSAQEAFKRYPKPSKVKNMTYPTGIERRGFRGNDLASLHLNGLYKKVEGAGIKPGIDAFIERGKRRKSWRVLREEFQTLPYAGPWSSYKWVDLLKNVHGFKIDANNIGVGGNSETAGPVPGMVLLMDMDWRRCATDTVVQRDLLSRCIDNDVKFNGLDQLETCLCDFNSLVKGRYYSGHDVDQQMEHLPKEKIWWEARRVAIPKRVRGEVGRRWVGVRKELKALYVKEGIIHTDL